MKVFKIYEKEFKHACIMRFAAGTTGYCGGDSGHGGRTVIEIEDLGSTDISFIPIFDRFNHQTGIAIQLGGDSELQGIIEGLEFMLRRLKELEKQSKK
jgi:hypothetical protein